MKEKTLQTAKYVYSDGISNVEAGYRRRQKKSIVISLVLLAIMLVLAAIMMLYGNTIYTPRQVWEALNEVEGSAIFTVKTLRLPRMLIAIWQALRLVWPETRFSSFWEIRLQALISSA